MAVPFNPGDPPEDPEERLRLLVLMLSESIEVLLGLIQQLAVQQQQTAERSNRLPSCEDDEEDDEDHDEPPTMASVAGVVTELPDVVPRPAPRASLTKWPARSPFTKYLGADAEANSSSASSASAMTSSTTAPPTTAPAARRQPVASSSTTQCYALPDLLCDVAACGPAPCPAPGPAPREAYSPAPCPARPAPWAYPPEPAPRRRRRPRKSEAQKCTLSAALSAAPSAVPSKWLPGDELEKTISKMAVSSASSTATRCDWVRVGEDLRRIADHFSQSMPSADEVDSPANPAEGKPASTSLLSMLLPPPVVKDSFKGTLLTTVVLMVGWKLLSRSR